MKTILGCILVLPTWILTEFLLPPVPKDNAWYGRHFTLIEWYRGATNLTKDFSIAFWSFGMGIMLSIMYIVGII